MSREELEEILRQECNKPDEMSTEWAIASWAAAQRAMVAAYNKGIEDAVKSVESEPDFDIVYLKRLKIV